MSEKELLNIKDTLDILKHIKNNIHLEIDCMENKKLNKVILKTKKNIKRIYQDIYALLEER